jgi:hypothetical protein
MLLQSLATIAVMVLLAGALLVSSLASATFALHEGATRSAGIALARGTHEVTAWISNFVHKNGAGGALPMQEQMLAPQPLCDDLTESGAPGASQPVRTGACAYATISYRVTGTTAGGADGSTGPDTAENLQTVVDEQRASVELTATITSASGEVLASGTRQLTLRLFDAQPWVVVTGTRDVSTVLGSIHAAEGDTAGQTGAGTASAIAATPNPLDPSSFQDTSIHVTMTCTNSSANSDPSRPDRDDQPPGNDNLPWGVQAQHGAFEAPCQPAYALSVSPGVPSDANLGVNGNYDVGTFRTSESWSNGSSTSAASWPQ